MSGLSKETRTVWGALVAYANGMAATEELRQALLLAVPWVARGAAFGILESSLSARFFPEEAAQHQPIVNQLLHALCERPNHPLPDEIWDFVRNHGSVETRFEEAPSFVPDETAPEFEERQQYWEKDQSRKNWEKTEGTSDTYAPRSTFLHGYVRTKDYKNVANLICDFVLDEYNRVRQPGEALPIVLCSNPSCGKLAVPEKRRKTGPNFCSEKCKDAAHREDVSSRDKADYQWLYRILNETETEAGQLAKLKKDPQRFREIKARKIPRCMAIVERLERTLDLRQLAVAKKSRA